MGTRDVGVGKGWRCRPEKARTFCWRDQRLDLGRNCRVVRVPRSSEYEAKHILVLLGRAVAKFLPAIANPPNLSGPTTWVLFVIKWESKLEL